MKAISIIKQDKNINTVITDVKMPGKSGLDLINIILEKFPERKFKMIIMTGHADLIESNYPNVDAIIKKPIDPFKLLEIL